MDMELVKMEKPLIQIDDEVREMTDEEHEAYLEQVAGAPELFSAD
jgi:hypothetical protein